MVSKCAKTAAVDVENTREYIADMILQLARMASAIGDDLVAQALAEVVEVRAAPACAEPPVERC